MTVFGSRRTEPAQREVGTAPVVVMPRPQTNSACVKEVADASKRSRLVGEGSDAHGEFLAAMEVGELRRSALFETLVLLATPLAIEAAHEVDLALWEMLRQAREHEPPPVVGDLHVRLNTYHERARQDLGISRDARRVF